MKRSITLARNRRRLYQFKATIQSLKQYYSPKTESRTHSSILKMAKL